jgi:thymidylate synthase
MTNEQIMLPYFKILYDKIINEDFVIDKTGSKVVEIIGCKIDKLNPLQPNLNFNEIRKTPEKYVDKELKWYLSQSLSIINYVDDIKIWNDVCTKDDKKEINSNYGWCIFSQENYNQYDFCLNELINNKESRRACMIYTRPSMTIEYNRNGMSDFICTFNTQQFIRNNKFIYIVNMRSNDFKSGFFSDFPWHCFVYNKLFNDLKNKYIDLQIGTIIWEANSFHVYERDFIMIQKIIESYYE